MRKLATILLLALALEVTSCRCKKAIPQTYTFSSLALENLDNSGLYPVVAVDSEIPKNTYGIRISLGREKQTTSPVMYCTAKRQSLLFQTASATSVECPYSFTPTNPVTRIKITTLNDFDSTHAADSEVTVYFKVFEDKDKNYSYFGISEYIGRINYYVSTNRYLGPYTFQILLMTAPSMGTSHTFKVGITLSDGTVFEQTTQAELV
ncbi:DUF5034 domain-containing protein [uncultured Alistipes sp.]|jgi:hypothetical protein|uniref:DUF5034 domain-containing protein n=1 Tax=uncultured Alistipes sp. TaxID=538949 RepID=UPI0025F1CDF5|nr:DUF5034 domain-containing protein [uncultured Alistipes sp.]